MINRAGNKISNLSLEELELNWDGVDQCRNWGLGALGFHIEMLHTMIDEGEYDDRRLHFLVWMMEDQFDRIDDYLERLYKAMRNEAMKNKIRVSA